MDNEGTKSVPNDEELGNSSRTTLPPESARTTNGWRRARRRDRVSARIRPPGRDVLERNHDSRSRVFGDSGVIVNGNGVEELYQERTGTEQRDDRQLGLFNTRSEPELSDLLQPERVDGDGPRGSDQDNHSRDVHIQPPGAVRGEDGRTASQIDVHRVNYHEAFSWALMPYALRRIESFCHEFDTDTRSTDAVSLLNAWFVNNDPKLGLWLVTRNYELVGHLWATPEPFGGEQPPQYLLIRQAQIDHGVNIGKASKVVFNSATAWARELGVSTIKMLTHRPAVAMARRWGFRPYKVMMTLDV